MLFFFLKPDHTLGIHLITLMVYSILLLRLRGSTNISYNINNNKHKFKMFRQFPYYFCCFYCYCYSKSAQDKILLLYICPHTHTYMCLVSYKANTETKAWCLASSVALTQPRVIWEMCLPLRTVCTGQDSLHWVGPSALVGPSVLGGTVCTGQACEHVYGGLS